MGLMLNLVRAAVALTTILGAVVSAGATARAQADPTPTVRELVEPAVVQIAQRATIVQDGNQTVREERTGSGTIVSPDGLILTNHHVVDTEPVAARLAAEQANLERQGKTLEFTIDDHYLIFTTGPFGNAIPSYLAAVVAQDPVTDLAVLRIAGGPRGQPLPARLALPFVELGDSNQVQRGDQLYLSGYPGGTDEIQFNSDEVTRLTTDEALPGDVGWGWIELPGQALSPGSSGGAAVDAAGRLVAVPTSVTAPVCQPGGDTNGDGITDAADECSPVGGAIARLRPINLALPLLHQVDPTSFPATPGSPASPTPVPASTSTPSLSAPTPEPPTSTPQPTIIPGATLTPVPSSPPAPAPEQLRVVDQQVIDIPGRPLALSPDGRWLAVLLAVEDADDKICSFATSTLTEHHCATFPEYRIDQNTAVWSPDSTRFAFGEDFRIQQREPDIWVFEAESGTLINLTDDGVSGSMMGDRDGSEYPLIDVAPAWSPDGRELVFARARAGDLSTMALYRIPATGGEPRELLEVQSDRTLPIYGGIRWSADGGTIYYSIDAGNDDADSGVWAVDADGANPRQIFGITDPEQGPPVLVGMAGNTVLLLYPRTLSTEAPPAASFAVADLTSGQVQLLESAGPDSQRGIVRAAALSPDGARILLAVSGAEGSQQQFVLRTIDGGAEMRLGESVWPVAIIAVPGGLQWTTNGLVFGVGGAYRGLLLRLQPEPVSTPPSSPMATADAASTALDPASQTITIETDLRGVLSGDNEAQEAARNALSSQLSRYPSSCQAGLIHISGYAWDLREGVELAQWGEEFLWEVRPDLVANAAIEHYAMLGEEPIGRVTIEMFFYSGCEPTG